MYVIDKGYPVDRNISAAGVNRETAAVDYQIIWDVQHTGPAGGRCIDSTINRAQDIPGAAALAAAVGDEKAKHLVINGRHPEVFRALTAAHENLERRGYDIIMVRERYPGGSVCRVYRRYAPNTNTPRQYFINISSQ